MLDSVRPVMGIISIGYLTLRYTYLFIYVKLPSQMAYAIDGPLPIGNFCPE